MSTTTMSTTNTTMANGRCRKHVALHLNLVDVAVFQAGLTHDLHDGVSGLLEMGGPVPVL